MHVLYNLLFSRQMGGRVERGGGELIDIGDRGQIQLGQKALSLWIKNSSLSMGTYMYPRYYF